MNENKILREKTYFKNATSLMSWYYDFREAKFFPKRYCKPLLLIKLHSCKLSKLGDLKKHLRNHKSSALLNAERSKPP